MAYRHVLTGEERRELLRLARAALRDYAAGGGISPERPNRTSLLDAAGAFVTLRNKENGSLRGCIGTQNEDRPLYRAVQEMAVAAATRDPRFSAVRPEEVDHLSIEISVLGDRRPVSGPSDVEVGRHGLYVACSGRRGLLLPQVAPENGWDADTFLARVCLKAGLADDAWEAPEATVERFTAQVFDEEELTATPAIH